MSPTRLTHWEGEPVGVWRELWAVPAVEAYAQIGSTNDRAQELVAEGCRAFTVVVADEQTEGRGRRAARWHSPAGAGLWMSVVLPCSGTGTTPHAPLLVGLAVAEAIEAGVGSVRVGIEWPNDLMIGGRKVGGILCESETGVVVAGIGINVRTPIGGFPTAIVQRATSLEAQGVNMLSHSTLARIVIAALKRRMGADTTHLGQDVLAELEARDVLAARAVHTEEHGQGTARGIDADGALILERPDGSRVRVLAGSVRPL